MSYLIRTRSNGRSFELRIKSKLLPKAIYFTFDSEAEAESFAKTAETFLAKGIVPESLLATPKLAFTDIAGAIRAYEKASAVPRSTSNVLDAVSANIGPTKLSAVDYAWAEAWILGQKLQHQRAPGTIRHHVGALSRALDWVTRRHPTYLAQNPLCQLPRGYATYNSAERRTLAATGVDAKRDTERNRRLSAIKKTDVRRAGLDQNN